MKKIVSICQAEKWFYVHESADDFTFHRVAVWAFYDDGSTQGLVSVVSENGSSMTRPPSVKGTYIHWDDMNETQKGRAELLGRVSIDNLKSS